MKKKYYSETVYVVVFMFKQEQVDLGFKGNGNATYKAK